MGIEKNFNDLFELIEVKENNINQSLIYSLTYPGSRDQEKVESKLHFKYLLNYLFKDKSGLNIKTIIIEKNYISASYLDDFHNYYAKCYYPYLKECRRIHFFNVEFNCAEFIKMLSTNTLEKKWSSYKGYIVIKPLPKGIIGASLLAPYKNKQKRFFTAIRNYSVNLFGKELTIKTMSYQEQDSIVGSCASASIWFAFQKTSQLFHTTIPSPSIITISAGNDSYATGKTFPSDVLETPQICKAISANGLVAEVIDWSTYLEDNKWLKSFIYSYLRMGIPVLLGIEIENKGYHLVTLNGFRFGEENEREISRLDLKLKSDKIIKFYAHDDQCGPYAKIEILKKKKYQLKTTIWENLNSKRTLNANPILVIVPHADSIKITFENILLEVSTLNIEIKKRTSLEFVWDIYVTESNNYKGEIIKEMKKNPENHYESTLEFLLKSLPKYIWVAQARLQVEKEEFLVFDLIYDALDVNYTASPYYLTFYNEDFKNKAIEVELFLENVFKRDFATKKSLYSDFADFLNEDSKITALIENKNVVLNETNQYTVAEIIQKLKEQKSEELFQLINAYVKSVQK